MFLPVPLRFHWFALVVVSLMIIATMGVATQSFYWCHDPFRFRFYTLWTWMFTHYNWFHLIINSISVLLFLPVVLKQRGWLFTLITFIIGGPFQIAVLNLFVDWTAPAYGISGLTAFWIAYTIMAELSKVRFLPFWIGDARMWLGLSVLMEISTFSANPGNLFHILGFGLGTLVGLMDKWLIHPKDCFHLLGSVEEQVVEQTRISSDET